MANNPNAHLQIKHEPEIPQTQSSKFGDTLLYKPATPLKPGVLIKMKMKEVDTVPVQLMVRTKALFEEYEVAGKVICGVVYGGFIVDLYEVDNNVFALTVHHR